MLAQGLEDYIEVLVQHKVDFDVLDEMDHDTLKEMEIQFGDRVRILRAIKSLKVAPTLEEDTNDPLASAATENAGGDDHRAARAVATTKTSLRVSPTARAAAVAATAAADEAALAAELERAHQKFAEIDADRSGKLSRDEVTAL
eukprot:COSAG02_NODE_14167_length_1302_cov_0.988362_1_plen_143_part_10